MVSLLLPVIYLAFISLGLPDALLGAAWPSMYPQLGAGVSWAGGVSMIISVGTIVSSLASDWLNNKLGTGRVTALSVAPQGTVKSRLARGRKQLKDLLEMEGEGAYEGA